MRGWGQNSPPQYYLLRVLLVHTARGKTGLGPCPTSSILLTWRVFFKNGIYRWGWRPRAWRPRRPDSLLPGCPSQLAGDLDKGHHSESPRSDPAAGICSNSLIEVKRSSLESSPEYRHGEPGVTRWYWVRDGPVWPRQMHLITINIVSFNASILAIPVSFSVQVIVLGRMSTIEGL